MTCFTNMPLYWIHANKRWVDWFIAGNISPELGIDCDSVLLPDSWHRDLAARFHAAGLRCSVHLPFMETEPCSPDPALRAASRAKLHRAAAIAKIYKAAHMIGHPYFRAESDAAPHGGPSAAWMEHALATWQDMPDIANAPLFLENTYEHAPAPVAALVAALCAARGETPLERASVGICFDIGHWHSFAGCTHPAELEPWLEAFAPFRLHLHLHDNTGEGDFHMGMGAGTIPLPALFASLAARRKKVTASLEPHDITAFLASVSWLDAHPDVARAIAWQGANIGSMPLDEIEKTLAP